MILLEHYRVSPCSAQRHDSQFGNKVKNYFHKVVKNRPGYMKIDTEAAERGPC